jgi:hypothetical protein
MRLPLAKLADVGEMLKDMQQCEVIFHRSTMKEQGPALLSGLQENDQNHDKKLFPTDLLTSWLQPKVLKQEIRSFLDYALITDGL